MTKLTRKQKTFVELLLNNPKMSATEAAMQSYNASNRDVARAIATENLAKPSIMSNLGIVNDLIEGVMVATVRDWGLSMDVDRRTLAVNTGKFMHDKIHGKATQRTENTDVHVNLDISLS